MRFITLDSNNKVIGVRYGTAIVLGEVESEIGELDQILQPDGTFITPEPIPIEPKPSLEEQIAGLKEDNLILMDVLATMYEDMLLKGTV